MIISVNQKCSKEKTRIAVSVCYPKFQKVQSCIPGPCIHVCIYIWICGSQVWITFLGDITSILRRLNTCFLLFKQSSGNLPKKKVVFWHVGQEANGLAGVQDFSKRGVQRVFPFVCSNYVILCGCGQFCTRLLYPQPFVSLPLCSVFQSFSININYGYLSTKRKMKK